MVKKEANTDEHGPAPTDTDKGKDKRLFVSVHDSPCSSMSDSYLANAPYLFLNLRTN